MIYAAHRYTRKADTTGPLEVFPSVERASVALQLRARKQESGTYYLDEDHSETPRPRVEFPQADLSGYMLVWRRRAGEDRPTPGDTPDEVWRLTPGGSVIKEVYDEGGRAYTLPQLTPDERRTKALHVLHELPPIQDEFRQDLDATYRHVLRDLVQDPEVEDAILRVMQFDWQQRRSQP